jgi:HAD superfamily hydrolase (TIGR01509 family)
MDTVVFDWDGTLVDTLGALLRANVAVLGELGIDFDEAAYRRHYAPDWRLMYARLGIPAERLDEVNERWLRHYGGDEVRPFPGTREALVALRSAGSRLGLVTAGHREIVEPQLAATGLGSLLEIAVFGDDLPVHKPDPAPLRHALSGLGARRPAESVVYVGDAPDDMRMARAVGVRAVGIASILGDPDELRAAGADEVAVSVAAWVAARRHDSAAAPAPDPAA